MTARSSWRRTSDGREVFRMAYRDGTVSVYVYRHGILSHGRTFRSRAGVLTAEIARRMSRPIS